MACRAWRFGLRKLKLHGNQPLFQPDYLGVSVLELLSQVGFYLLSF